MSRPLIVKSGNLRFHSRHAPVGEASLVVDREHFDTVVRNGVLQARVSIDIMTADFKAMLVPLGPLGAGNSKFIPPGAGDPKFESRNSKKSQIRKSERLQTPIPRPALQGRDRDRRAPSIVEILRSLADRDVEIRLLHAGVPSSAALRELKRALPHNLTIRRCPRLHAKAVIIDSARMYLGSANLTGAGLGAKSDGKRNFELGIWTESSHLIDAVLEQFNTLWEGRHCETCRRRDVCPVPLEEPALGR